MEHDVKNRSPEAASLAEPQFRQRKVPDKTKYKRDRKVILLETDWRWKVNGPSEREGRE